MEKIYFILLLLGLSINTSTYADNNLPSAYYHTQTRLLSIPSVMADPGYAHYYAYDNVVVKLHDNGHWQVLQAEDKGKRTLNNIYNNVTAQFFQGEMVHLKKFFIDQQAYKDGILWLKKDGTYQVLQYDNNNTLPSCEAHPDPAEKASKIKVAMSKPEVDKVIGCSGHILFVKVYDNPDFKDDKDLYGKVVFIVIYQSYQHREYMYVNFMVNQGVMQYIDQPKPIVRIFDFCDTFPGYKEGICAE